MPICRLCLKEAKLMRSHIFPDHLYRDVRDDDNRFVGIMNTGRTQLRQQGMWDHLFCHDCEQLLSREYENYFADFWLNNTALPDEATGEVSIRGIDYKKFKLYHLSILFRASVATQPSFAHVNLGPHEDSMRKLILGEEDDKRYHIVGAVLVKEDHRVVKGLFTFPQLMRVEGYIFYLTMYGGCAWMIKVSNHEWPGIEGAGLREDGTLTMPCERWESFRTIQLARELLLRGTERSA